jgi:preprotein translocase subunit SecD
VPKATKWKVVSFILCSLIAFIYAAPNFIPMQPGYLPSSKVNLGLDLRGGAHLLLDVDFDSYLNDLLENISDRLKKIFRDEKIGYKNLAIGKNSLRFNIRDQEDLDKIKKAIKSASLEMELNYKDEQFTLTFSDNALDRLRQKIIEQSIEIIRLRVDSSGTTEPIIQRQGQAHILLQVPGAEDPSEIKSVLGKTAKLSFHLVNENANLEQALNGNVPSDSMLSKGVDHNKESYYVVVKKKPILSGDQLTDAQVTYNQNSETVVAFSFNKYGGKIFGEFTKANRGKRLAIILDNNLLSAPVINEPIMGGNGIISGNFTVESANELALLLRAGALPAPLKIIEERSIGPNLGADSIEAGKKAGAIGFALVVIFMLWSYGILGLFATIALSFTMLYILALLSMLGATLTLPGIAGIILTIGMAVDANVLIYERVREEKRKGASNLYSIKAGFESAFSTIVDSNITTLVAAFLLYIFGVGAIKGFAVTLTIGIISSMFAAIIITKLQIDLWLKIFKPKSLGL